MEIEPELQGVDEALQTFSNVIDRQEQAVKDALEYILIQLVNYAKHYAPFTDRTGNLRNSISVNFGTMNVYREGEQPPSDRITSTPEVHVEGDDYTGYLSAGMEYAIWVEAKDGYWVLQGSIDKIEPLISKHLYEHLAVDRMDLEGEITRILGGEAG